MVLIPTFVTASAGFRFIGITGWTHGKIIPLPTGLFDKVIDIFKGKIVQYDFGLIHILAEKHQGPDGLSRHKPIPGEDDPEEWVDDYLALYGST